MVANQHGAHAIRTNAHTKVEASNSPSQRVQVDTLDNQTRTKAQHLIVAHPQRVPRIVRPKGLVDAPVLRRDAAVVDETAGAILGGNNAKVGRVDRRQRRVRTVGHQSVRALHVARDIGGVGPRVHVGQTDNQIIGAVDAVLPDMLDSGLDVRLRDAIEAQVVRVRVGKRSTTVWTRRRRPHVGLRAIRKRQADTVRAKAIGPARLGGRLEEARQDALLVQVAHVAQHRGDVVVDVDAAGFLKPAGRPAHLAVAATQGQHVPVALGALRVGLRVLGGVLEAGANPRPVLDTKVGRECNHATVVVAVEATVDNLNGRVDVVQDRLVARAVTQPKPCQLRCVPRAGQSNVG